MSKKNNYTKSTLKLVNMLSGFFVGVLIILIIYLFILNKPNNTNLGNNSSTEKNQNHKKDKECNSDYNPVCGEDFKSYVNVCEANLAGVEVLNNGFCEDTKNISLLLKQNCNNKCCKDSIEYIVEKKLKQIDSNGGCQSGYNKKDLGCEGSYSWCEKIKGYSAEADLYSDENIFLNKNNLIKDSENTSISSGKLNNNLTKKIDLSNTKTSDYYQKNLKYGFSMLYGNYYESFKGEKDAIATVGIRWMKPLDGDINNADIKVYLYSRFKTKKDIEKNFLNNLGALNNVFIIEKNNRLAVIESVNNVNNKNTLDIIKQTFILEKLK